MKRRMFIGTGAFTGTAGAAAIGAKDSRGKGMVREMTGSPIIYFESPGPSNTDDVIEAVR